MNPIYQTTIAPSIPVKFFRHPSGRWIGIAELRTPAGVIRLSAGADEATIRAAMVQAAKMQFLQAKRAGASSGFLGGLFRRIGKIASSAVSVVSNLARGRIAAALKSAVSLAREGLPVVALAIPGIGTIAATSITVASSLLSRARRGDPSARRALATNAEAARRGDAAALRRQRIFQAVAMKSAAIRRRRQQTAMPRPISSELAAIAGQYQIAGDNNTPGRFGQWTTASNGAAVFTPAAMAGGILWDQLRPHLGYRSGPSSFITSRSAYHGGLTALAQMRR